MVITEIVKAFLSGLKWFLVFTLIYHTPPLVKGDGVNLLPFIFKPNRFVIASFGGRFSYQRLPVS